jgi:outer membrane protein assembly factor BamA
LYNLGAVQKASFVVIIQAALLATSLWAVQGTDDNPKVLLKDIHFAGDLGVPLSELQEYTEYLIGHRMERAKILEDGPMAVTKALRHRGYLKAQVTPEIHSLKRSVGSKDAEVALDLTIKAGKQYRVKDMTFVGLSAELPQADLRQAFNMQRGDVADAEKISVGIGNLQARFQQKGKEVFVVPEMTFDDTASTVSLQFDVEK